MAVRRTVKIAHEPAVSRKVQVRSCRTCGKKAPSEHLCTASRNLARRFYWCSYCGLTSNSPNHVCKPKLMEMKYYCANCGRLTPLRGTLCRPTAIR